MITRVGWGILAAVVLLSVADAMGKECDAAGWRIERTSVTSEDAPPDTLDRERDRWPLTATIWSSDFVISDFLFRPGNER